MSQTVVIKIGTSSLTHAETGYLALATIASLVEVLCQLRAAGHQIVLVSSGAVGVGCARLKLTERPRAIALKQAVAAVGQGRLMRIYDDFFSVLNQPIAQVLLTRADLADRNRYLNASNTFQELLRLGVIPIVNENDTVAVDELKFGDNDTLSALVASLVHADWLFLLTDVDSLYSADPRTNPQAQPIHIIERMEDLVTLQVQAGGQGSRWGTGGMSTKISAAEIATDAGVRTVITHGQTPTNIPRILAGEPIGTQFLPHPAPINARKHWIAHTLVPAGTLILDDGAAGAIINQGKSLLAAGIQRIEGEFDPQQAIRLCNLAGEEVARGLVNYSSTELHQIRGRHSEEIAVILGYAGADTVIHRDNLVVL
ncbi:MAG: glutamate 5-kinase [Thermosynechococcaceae cyanobacterium MS004]|nr:glutamate 5-kinase [Thermosynechococcaceae cyanobacterium MS004]